MNRTRQFVLAVMTAALLTGCTQAPVQTDPAQGAGPAEPAVPAEQAPAADADRGGQAQTGQDGAVSREAALAVALENAGVSAADAYNIRTERDEESGIPVYDIEFETDYGDYDFQVARSDSQIVGADYEVDEEWLDTLGGTPVTAEEAGDLVLEKIPGAEKEDVRIWEEQEDGRGRYEGEAFSGGLKYEFEIDPQTGRIYDWNADLRE